MDFGWLLNVDTSWVMTMVAVHGGGVLRHGLLKALHL
jgi:hypothetical protein